LDGIRGIAAFIVAVPLHYHSFFEYFANARLNNRILLSVAGWGGMMVEVFFMLSGFIFFNKYGEKISSRAISKKVFFILRFSRLYPLHWLTLFIIAAGILAAKCLSVSAFAVHGNNNLFSFLQNLLCVQNGWLQTISTFNGPAWSVSIEIMMYIVFYALFYHAGSGRKRFTLCLFLIYLGVMMYASGWEGPLFSTQTGRGLVCFFIGVLIGDILSRPKSIKREKLLVSVSVFTAILSSVLIFWLSKDKSGIYRYFVYVLALFPALFILSLRLRILSALLSLKPLLYLGAISYSMYLMHFPIALTIIMAGKLFGLKIDYSSGITFFSYITVVVIISHISHFYFEKPLQSYIRRKSGLG
jgi:peptidoglycan/LPS O-acetylase OafA/YrhL